MRESYGGSEEKSGRRSDIGKRGNGELSTSHFLSNDLNIPELFAATQKLKEVTGSRFQQRHISDIDPRLSQRPLSSCQMSPPNQ